MNNAIVSAWSAIEPDSAAYERMLNGILKENAARRAAAERNRRVRRTAIPAAACLAVAAAAVTVSRTGLLKPQTDPAGTSPYVVVAPVSSTAPSPEPPVTAGPGESPTPSAGPVTPVTPENATPSAETTTPVTPEDATPSAELTTPEAPEVTEPPVETEDPPAEATEPVDPEPSGEPSPTPSGSPVDEPVFIPRKLGGGNADSGTAPSLEEFRSLIEPPDTEGLKTLPVYRVEKKQEDVWARYHKEIKGYPGDLTVEDLRVLLETDPVYREALVSEHITDPVISRCVWYSLHGERNATVFTVWQNTEDPLERIVSKGVAPLVIMLWPTEELDHVDIMQRDRDSFAAVGQYPLISEEQARERLLEENGVTEDQILACELTYTDRLYEDYFVPAYVFYYEMPYPLPEEGTKAYNEALLSRADAAYADALPDEEAAQRAREEVLERGTLIDEEMHLYYAAHIDAVELPIFIPQ